MGNRIRVSLDRMESDQDRILEQMERTRIEVGKLSDSMQKLSGCWEGPAWTAFQAAVADDIEYMQGVYQEMRLFISNLNDSEKKYLQGERQNYDAMNSIWV